MAQQNRLFEQDQPQKRRTRRRPASRYARFKKQIEATLECFEPHKKQEATHVRNT